MADLSHLTDEQLEAYRDLLAAKQQPEHPGPAKAPIPEGLKPQPPSPFHRFASNFGENINPVPGLTQLATHPLDTARGMVQHSGEEANAVLPSIRSGHFSEALRHGIGALPLIGPPAAKSLQQAQEGDYAGSLGTGLGMAVPALAGEPIAKAGGSMLKAAARPIAAPIAESAMGIRGAERAFGATPGKAILEETSGARPGTVEASARNRIGQLSGKLDTKAQLANNTVDLAPARARIQSAMSTAERQNAPAIHEALKPLETSLTTRFSPQGPLPGKLPVPEALELRRGFGKEHVQFKPNPLAPRFNDVNEAAKGAYHDISEGIHQAAPGTAALDQRIQSLIPVKNRAKITDLNSDLINRAVSHPVRSVLSAVGGYALGGAPGATATLGLPEVFSLPAAKMAIARSLYGPGKALVSPAGKYLIRGVPLTQGLAPSEK